MVSKVYLQALYPSRGIAPPLYSKPLYSKQTLNPLDAMGISLNKQKLMYKVLAPSIMIDPI